MVPFANSKQFAVMKIKL